MPKVSLENQSEYFGTKRFQEIFTIPPSTQSLWREKGMPYYQPPGTSKILYKRDEIIEWFERGKSKL